MGNAFRKAFIFKYLENLVDQYKEIPFEDRFFAYIKYFVDNFNYKNEMRDEILADNYLESFENNEKYLFELFTTRYGVCQQFAQAFTLLSKIDKDFEINNCDVFYCCCNLIINGKNVGHALNICQMPSGQVYVIDISSMIHSRDSEYKSSQDKFCFVTLSEYIENLRAENMDLMPLRNGKNGVDYLVGYKSLPVNDLYNRMNLSANEMNTSYRKEFFAVGLTNKNEKEA